MLAGLLNSDVHCLLDGVVVDCWVWFSPFGGLDAPSTITSKQAKPTTDRMAMIKQLLKYPASQEEAVLSYSASEMVLAVHINAGYLNEPKTRSRAGEHFFLFNHVANPPNNGAILHIAHIIKNAMSSATEAEPGALSILQERRSTSTTFSRQWATEKLQHQSKQTT